MIELPGKWIWDSWFARGDDGLWRAYFLQADAALGDPDLRHWNVSIGHATSRDLTNWTHLGAAFAPAKAPAWDDYTIWTGCVVRGDDRRWNLFYTGTSRAEKGLKQRIGRMVGDDMSNWTRAGDSPVLDLSGELYEEYAPGRWHDRAMRDPWVIRDPDGTGWLMFFTARIPPGPEEANARGAIGLASSPNLAEWTLLPPVFTGGFGQLEVPQVFARNGRWYCLFCTAAEHWSSARVAAHPGRPVSGTHYLLADHPRGPWRIAPGPFLDGDFPCRRYAGRIVEDGEKLLLLGFLDSPDGIPFVGKVDDPQLVEVAPDGLLRLAPRQGGGNG